MTIGSHSHSHRVLKTLDAAAELEELVASKALLEEKIGREVRVLAYPAGGYQHFAERTKMAAAATGYRLAFSFNTGVNRSGKLDRYDIKRLGAPARPGRLAAMTAYPQLFAWRA